MYIEEEFNGYTNKPTWTLAIWLETDESLKNYWKYKTKSLPEDELSKELQVYFEDRNPLSMEFTFYSDILTNSIKLINWTEVAKKLKDNEREELVQRNSADTVTNLLVRESLEISSGDNNLNKKKPGI
jgi:hypothetical protein